MSKVNLNKKNWLARGAEPVKNNSGLLNRFRALRDFVQRPSGAHEVLSEPKADARLAHLFSDTAYSHGEGTVSLPWKIRPVNRYLPELLDFQRCVAPFAEPKLSRLIDVYCTWGVTDSNAHNLARRAARKYDKPLLSLEYGFVSSATIALHDSVQHSLLISTDTMYYDATQPSYMERRLNDPTFGLTQTQSVRAREAMASLVRSRVTKYNHAPEVNLKERLGLEGDRRILLVDQRFGDASIAKGGADESTFRRMIETALEEYPDHELLVKVHPDALIGGKGSYLGRQLPQFRDQRIRVLDFDVNPYCIFDVVSHVFVATSQMGFEGLLAGKQVTCFGQPFYAGWGLTQDRARLPRRKTRRSLEEIFHLFYLECSRYFTPGAGVCEFECLVDYFAAMRRHTNIVLPKAPTGIEILGWEEQRALLRPNAPARTEPKQGAVDTSTPASAQQKAARRSMRVLFVIPSPRMGASGRYMQVLGWYLVRLGCEVMLLAEGKSKREMNGVLLECIEFEGLRLAPRLRKAIRDFAPTVIYENGVRTRAQRATIEALLLTDAHLAMQSEDDDIQVYVNRHKRPNVGALTLLDKPLPSPQELAEFLKRNDWEHTLEVLLDPAKDRWVESTLRALCYHLAGLHTAIWYPFEKRLRKEYGVETMVVPPVVNLAKYEPVVGDAVDRAEVLRSIQVDPASHVLFIAGTVYSYSDEYRVFLQALNQLQALSPKPVTLVCTGRTSVEVDELANETLVGGVSYVNLRGPDDDVYLKVLKACDVVCAPGVPDTFNELRLPSRLVKAMALGKPVFTFRVGFGESLQHGVNAFLTDTDNPAEWASKLLETLDQKKREDVGLAGRRFAEEHFDAKVVAVALLEKLKELVKRPKPFSHSPVAALATEVVEQTAGQASVRSNGLAP